jgi:hypothetical protein
MAGGPDATDLFVTGGRLRGLQAAIQRAIDGIAGGRDALQACFMANYTE